MRQLSQMSLLVELSGDCDWKGNGLMAIHRKYPIHERHMRILGRTLAIGGVTWLGYSGSGIEFCTDAESVQAELIGLTATGERSDFAWIGIFLDDEEKMYRKLLIRRELRSYDICRNPDRKQIRVRIVKLTEERCDTVGIACVTALEGTIRPAPARPHRILFIGDSLTAGYGVLKSQDPEQPYAFTTTDEDVTKAYPYITAMHLNADAQFFCWSGNGIISRWIDESTDIPITEDLMPALYPYTAKHTEQVVTITMQAKGGRPFAAGFEEDHEETQDTKYSSQSTDVSGNRKNGLQLLDRWAFSPDLVVTNLGTNDASFVRGIPVREQHFVQRYLELLRSIARDYPFARILVTYGMMEKSLSEACERVAGLGNFDYLELPLMDPFLDGFGGGLHPSAQTHEKTANVLCYKICQMTGWKV